jgi:hypothetical protein
VRRGAETLSNFTIVIHISSPIGDSRNGSTGNLSEMALAYADWTLFSGQCYRYKASDQSVQARRHRSTSRPVSPSMRL